VAGQLDDFVCDGQSIAEYVRATASHVALSIACVRHPAFFKADCRIITSASQIFETRAECRTKGIVFKPPLPPLYVCAGGDRLQRTPPRAFPS
jgi:hypothetical protein